MQPTLFRYEQKLHSTSMFVILPLQVLNYRVQGWIDWNMALDLTGGPNWANNFVDSPIIVNATANEFYKQPMFYVLGHFSKFIIRDSIRILTSVKPSGVIEAVAVKTPQDTTVVVLLNR
jgi:glucosylceramidase